jgi:hypothetical protein
MSCGLLKLRERGQDVGVGEGEAEEIAAKDGISTAQSAEVVAAVFAREFLLDAC